MEDTVEVQRQLFLQKVNEYYEEKPNKKPWSQEEMDNTVIEANVRVKTTDGYLLRVFCIGFTNKNVMSGRKTCYAQRKKVRKIRQLMIVMMKDNVTKCDLKEVVKKLLPDSIAKDIEKKCEHIFPIHDVHITKVKVLKKPCFELSKLLEIHSEDSGAIVDRPEGYEPPIKECV